MVHYVLHAERYFFNSMLPVSLYYTDSSSSLGWHSHDFMEIAIMLEGQAVYETDFSRQVIRSGDVVMIPPSGRHRYGEECGVQLMNVLLQLDKLPVPDEEVIRHPGFVMLFRLKSDFYVKHHFYPQLHLPPEDVLRISEILIPAWQEQKHKTLGANLTVYGAFLQALPILLRAYRGKTCEATARRVPQRLVSCLDYMNDHCHESLTLEDLARQTKMSSASFLRRFKSATGYTPINYLIKLRLDQAMVMLRDEHLTISEIAFAVGFTDSNYFSRLFRKYHGLSPSQYRAGT